MIKPYRVLLWPNGIIGGNAFEIKNAVKYSSENNPVINFVCEDGKIFMVNSLEFIIEVFPPELLKPEE